MEMILKTRHQHRGKFFPVGKYYPLKLHVISKFQDHFTFAIDKIDINDCLQTLIFV